MIELGVDCRNRKIERSVERYGVNSGCRLTERDDDTSITHGGDGVTSRTDIRHKLNENRITRTIPLQSYEKYMKREVRGTGCQVRATRQTSSVLKGI
jgi:hypothetical protein